MLKAAKPEKNEKTAAISPIFADCQSALKITSDPNNVPDAIIVGIDISIDMFALSKRLKPSCLAPIIVIPERDDPGIKAIACQIPILQASIKSQSFLLCLVVIFGLQSIIKYQIKALPNLLYE